MIVTKHGATLVRERVLRALGNGYGLPRHQLYALAKCSRLSFNEALRVLKKQNKIVFRDGYWHYASSEIK